MKKLFAVLSALAVLALAACGGSAGEGGDLRDKGEDVDLTLWTYPVGGWGNLVTVSSQLTSFHRAYPHINVTVKTVDYVTGDAKVEEAIANGEAPDLIFEGPERLVAWGERGLMADIGDLWKEEAAEDIFSNIKAACCNTEGAYYIYPICMTTHCMAINRDMFDKAGALQYINEEEHTWTTDGFFSAVHALNDYLKGEPKKHVAAVYCGGQGGDQGTRALVTNLYKGTFTDITHTSYTVDSEENIRALRELSETEGIVFDAEMLGSTEQEAFCAGNLAMAFCWNVASEITHTINDSFDFDILPMAFPTSEGDPQLQGGIWGFGVFDNKDPSRIEAAKTLIRYFTTDQTRYESAVLTTTYWPVKDLNTLYVNDKIMSEYIIFRQYLGDYYQVSPYWAEARTAWWNMLQAIGNKMPVEEAVAEFFPDGMPHPPRA